MLNGTTRVLVLDDDEDTRFAICRIMRKCDCEVFEAETVQASIDIIERGGIDIVISDLRIPGGDGGEELLQIVAQDYPDVQVVLMSCAMDEATREKLNSMGAAECLQKPFYKDTCMELLDQLRGSLRKSA